MSSCVSDVPTGVGVCKWCILQKWQCLEGKCWLTKSYQSTRRSWSMYPPWTNPMWCTMFFLCPFSPKISVLSYHCPASSRPRWFPPSPAGWTSPSSQGPHRPKKWIVATWCPTSSGRHWAGPRMMEHQPPHRGKMGKMVSFLVEDEMGYSTQCLNKCT